MQSMLKGYILKAEDVEMKDKNTGTPINMGKLTIYDEETGETRTDWITEENSKGFNPKLVSQIRGYKVTDLTLPTIS